MTHVHTAASLQSDVLLLPHRVYRGGRGRRSPVARPQHPVPQHHRRRQHGSQGGLHTTPHHTHHSPFSSARMWPIVYTDMSSLRIYTTYHPCPLSCRWAFRARTTPPAPASVAVSHSNSAPPRFERVGAQLQGSFQLRFSGYSTPSLAYDVDALTMQVTTSLIPSPYHCGLFLSFVY